jgi:hypothetical protein
MRRSCIVDERGGIKLSNPFVRGKAPKLVVDVTDYGYQYAGIRWMAATMCTSAPIISSCRSTRLATRSESGLELDAGHIWVPMDDVNCMVYNRATVPTDR